MVSPVCLWHVRALASNPAFVSRSYVNRASGFGLPTQLAWPQASPRLLTRTEARLHMPGATSRARVFALILRSLPKHARHVHHETVQSQTRAHRHMYIMRQAQAHNTQHNTQRPTITLVRTTTSILVYNQISNARVLTMMALLTARGIVQLASGRCRNWNEFVMVATSRM